MQEIDYAAPDARLIFQNLWQWAPFVAWLIFRIVALPKPGKISPDASRSVTGRNLFVLVLAAAWLCFYLTTSYDAITDLMDESATWNYWLWAVTLGLVLLMVLVELLHWRSLRFVDIVTEIQDRIILRQRRFERMLRLLLATGLVAWVLLFAAMARWLWKLGYGH